MNYEFFSEEIARTLPPLGSQKKLGDGGIAYVRFYTPLSGWVWYATEYDPSQQRFFGLVFGFEIEPRSFTLQELLAVKSSGSLPVERDVNWDPMTLAEVRKLHRRSEAP